MRAICILLLVVISLFHMETYASREPLLDEEFQSLNKVRLQPTAGIADDEHAQNSLTSTISKWELIQQNLWKIYIERSKAIKKRNPEQKPIDLMAIIDCYTYYGENMKEFSGNVRGGLGLYKTDYIEYLWARCNQVKRAAAERGGINAMKEKDPEGYKQLIRDILRQPIEFIEPPQQK
jgi:hypothetical protein